MKFLLGATAIRENTKVPLYSSSEYRTTLLHENRSVWIEGLIRR
jgi:hypothetical protein